MKTDQTNKVTMFKSVNAYLGQNNAVWRGMAPMVTAVQQFSDTIAAIDVAAQKQETPITGATIDKAAARDALQDVLFLMSQALGVLAHDANDQDLVALTDLTPTALERMRFEELGNRAANLVTAATSRREALATLNVTPANLDELNQALEAFNTAKESPRTATATRMAQTESLPELLRDARSILRNQIDPMVDLFRRTNGDFVAGYHQVRVIVDRAATHKTTPPPHVVSTSPPPEH